MLNQKMLTARADRSLTLGSLATFVAESTSRTAAAGAVTCNTGSGRITTESITTAAAATYTLTLTNSVIRAVDKVFVSIGRSAGTGGVPTLATVTVANGSVVIVVRNSHATDAFGAASTLAIDFFVVKAA